MTNYQSPRESFTSSSTGTSSSRYTNSGFLTAASLSSIDHQSTASSAIHFLSDSMIASESQDFDIIDSLNYEDIDETLLGTLVFFFLYFSILLTISHTDHELTHRNREKIVNTLIRSEQGYTNSLHLVKQLFLVPLRKDTKQSTFSFLTSKKVPCTEREYRWLFGNYEEIIKLHDMVLSSLKER